MNWQSRTWPARRPRTWPAPRTRTWPAPRPSWVSFLLHFKDSPLDAPPPLPCSHSRTPARCEAGIRPQAPPRAVALHRSSLGPCHTYTHTHTHTHTHTRVLTCTVAGLRGGGSITRTRAQRHPSPCALASGRTVPGSSGKPAQKGDKGGGGGGGGGGGQGVDASRRNPTWGELAFIGFVSGATQS